MVQLSIHKVLPLLGISLSGYYLTQVTSASPVYLSSVAYFLFFLLLAAAGLNPVPNRPSLIAYGLVFYYALTQASTGRIQDAANVACSILYFPVTSALLRRRSVKWIEDVGALFVRATIPLLSIEAGFRILNPVESLISVTGQIMAYDDSFYSFKLNSIMFGDSNFVGNLIVVLYFLTLYLAIKRGRRALPEILVLGVLTILTFSRASMVAIVLGTIFFLLRRRKLILALFLGAAGTATGMLFSTDASLLSKFTILSLGGESWGDLPWTQRLIGWGFGNSVLYLGVGAHDLFLTMLLESGLVGFVTYFSLLFVIWRQAPATGILIFPFLVNGFSLMNHGVPFFFASLAIVHAIETKGAKHGT